MVHLAELVEFKPEERVHQVVRRHAMTLWPRLVIAGLVIVIPFFLLFFLTAWKTVGTIIFALLVAFGLFLSIRAFLMWDSTVLVLTSHRVCQINQHGIWKRVVVDTPLAFVQGVTTERAGWLDALWNMGTVKIQTSDTDHVASTKIKTPEKIQTLINELREKRAWQIEIKSEDIPGAALVERPLLVRIIEMMNEAEPITLQEIENLLKNKKK